MNCTRLFVWDSLPHRQHSSFIGWKERDDQDTEARVYTQLHSTRRDRRKFRAPGGRKWNFPSWKHVKINKMVWWSGTTEQLGRIQMPSGWLVKLVSFIHLAEIQPEHWAGQIIHPTAKSIRTPDPRAQTVTTKSNKKNLTLNLHLQLWKNIPRVWDTGVFILASKTVDIFECFRSSHCGIVVLYR